MDQRLNFGGAAGGLAPFHQPGVFGRKFVGQRAIEDQVELSIGQFSQRVAQLGMVFRRQERWINRNTVLQRRTDQKCHYIEEEAIADEQNLPLTRACRGGDNRVDFLKLRLKLRQVSR